VQLGLFPSNILKNQFLRSSSIGLASVGAQW
jgi:hypothetical protein